MGYGHLPKLERFLHMQALRRIGRQKFAKGLSQCPWIALS